MKREVTVRDLSKLKAARKALELKRTQLRETPDISQPNWTGANRRSRRKPKRSRVVGDWHLNNDK